MQAVKHIRNGLPSGVVFFLVAVTAVSRDRARERCSLVLGVDHCNRWWDRRWSLSGSALGVSGPGAGLAVVFGAIETLGSFEAFLAVVVLSGFLQIGFGFARAGVLAYGGGTDEPAGTRGARRRGNAVDRRGRAGARVRQHDHPSGRAFVPVLGQRNAANGEGCASSQIDLVDAYALSVRPAIAHTGRSPPRRGTSRTACGVHAATRSSWARRRAQAGGSDR